VLVAAMPPGTIAIHRMKSAARFHLSEATVKTHVARILAKLNLRDRAQAVVVAYETGLITPGVA
jgi:DNA-binding CsgD family transcriptional regulator